MPIKHTQIVMLTAAVFSSLPISDSSSPDHSVFLSSSKPAFPHLSTSYQYQASHLSSSPDPHSQLQYKDNSCLSLVKDGIYCYHFALHSLFSSACLFTTACLCLFCLPPQSTFTRLVIHCHKIDRIKTINNHSIN